MNAPVRHHLVTQAEFFDQGYDVVVHHAGTGDVKHLGGTAASIWALIDGRSSVDQIVGELAELYSVDPSVIDGDVRLALDEFAKVSLLEPGPESSTVVGGAAGEAPAATATAGHPMPRPPDP